jgi:uncharacterized membrane protein YeaQ/YmgE (transglycosylase-associated protein family)
MFFNLVIYLLVGGLAGWLAGHLMQGKSLGLVANIVVGITGGLIGGWLFEVFGVDAGYRFSGALITATVGAMVLLWLIRVIKR